MNKFKAALFDLDGTLVDTEGQYTVFWDAMGKKYRPDVPNLAQIIKGTTLVQIFDNFFPEQQWREEITAGLDEWERNMSYPFIPGALDFLRDIKEHGVKCAVVTSSNKRKIEALRAKLPDFDSLFDRILTSEDFSASKPDPDCYNLGAKVFNCKKKECIVFEDAFTGLQAGMSSGIFTVGLTTYNSREAITDKCNHVIADFTELTFEKAEELLNIKPAKQAKETKEKKTKTTKTLKTAKAKKEQNTEKAEEVQTENTGHQQANEQTAKEQQQVKEQTAKEQPQAKEQTAKEQQQVKEQKNVSPCPTMYIHDIVDLINAPQRQIILNDQQIQHLSSEEATKRYVWFEETLARVLDYDIVISDTNIWLDLLTGHTSSHSDPRFNARLQFERQLEFISRLTKHRHGRFMIMSETYEEIDRFASAMDPVSHKEADFSDEATCRNIAARLAKRLILSQQRENRLRIEGIGAESHHSAFADPAIIRRCVELFAQGKKVLLITNDASVAIRSMGMCDDLQRTNDIDDETWDNTYSALRPMVMTMDDLKILDVYTRQYHFLQMASGKQWMEDVPQDMEKHNVNALALWNEGFKRRNQQKQENHDQRKEKQEKQQQKKQETKQQEQKKEQQQQQQQQSQAQQQQPQAQAQQQRQQQQKAAKEHKTQKQKQAKKQPNKQAEQQEPQQQNAPEQATLVPAAESGKPLPPMPQETKAITPAVTEPIAEPVNEPVNEPTKPAAEPAKPRRRNTGTRTNSRKPAKKTAKQAAPDIATHTEQ